MKKKKILFVLPTLKGGGAERVTCNLMNELDKKELKYEVGLFLFHHVGDYWGLVDERIPIYSASKDSGYSIPNCLIELVKKAQDYDVIVGAMELTTTYLSVIAGKLTGKKVVGWVHINIDSLLKEKNTIISFLHKRIFMPFFYNNIDRIVFVSKGARGNFLKYLAENSDDKAKCIYNPINLCEVRKMGEELIGEKYNHLLIAVGRLEEQKNYPLLLRAFKLVLQDIPDSKLMILGKGKLEKQLKQMAMALGIYESIYFEGFKENPYKYMNASDVFILSSHYEGLPTVLIEALALNKPIVSVDCPDGVKEILCDGKYGVIVPNYDEKALSKAIIELLQNQEKRCELAALASEAVMPFDSARVVDDYEYLFDDVCKNK